MVRQSSSTSRFTAGAAGANRGRAHESQRGLRLRDRATLGEVAVRGDRTVHGPLRKQAETLSEQSKELATPAQKIATEAAEPIREGVNKAFTRGGLTQGTVVRTARCVPPRVLVLW